MRISFILAPHASVPPNLFIAEPLYLTKYIERMGTDIQDMIDGGLWFTTVWRETNVR